MSVCARLLSGAGDEGLEKADEVGEELPATRGVERSRTNCVESLLIVFVRRGPARVSLASRTALRMNSVMRSAKAASPLRRRIEVDRPGAGSAW